MTNNGFRVVRKSLSILLLLTMVVAILAACSGSSDKSPEKRVLRIGVLEGDESYIRSQFTDMYEMMTPAIDFEVVVGFDWNEQRFQQPDPKTGMIDQPDRYKKMKEMLSGSNPVDVVVLDFTMLRRLMQDNLLKQLDPLIAQDKFDVSDYVPTVIDSLKTAGDGNIYALTPTFNSSALFYNKKIFADAGIEPPTDNMTWDDIMNKARQLSKGEGKDRVYGFSFSRWTDPFTDVQTYSAPLQLKMWDDSVERMTVNTPNWEKVWTDVSSLYKDKIVPSQEDAQLYQSSNGNADAAFNPFTGDLFMTGNVAMTIGHSSYTNDLKSAADNAAKLKDFTPVDWDVVTIPQHQEAPNIGGNVYLSQLLGINQNAQNAEDAWEFVKFVNGKEWAELKSRSNYELVARKEYLKPKDGMSYNIDAFTKLQPVPQTSNLEDVYRTKPGIYEAIQPGHTLFQEVVKGTKSVKEALEQWETQGNVVLEKLKNNPSGNPTVGGDTVTEAVTKPAP